jgi:hypothetical protein
MPNFRKQFNGGILVYIDAVDMSQVGAILPTQDAIDKAYSAACQALNKLNVIRAEWQKQNKKEV